MECQNQIIEYFAGIKDVLSKLPLKNIEQFIEILLNAYKNNKQVFTFGNGGYGSTASHVVNDLQKHTIVADNKNKILTNMQRFRAMCLCDNTSILTAWTNDVGFDVCFSEQLKNWIREGDIVVGLSGSGNSDNLLIALKTAKKLGAFTICLLGKGGGKAKNITDLSIIIPSDFDLFIEDIQLSILHLCVNVLRKEIQK
jgi:D-sedoheptulose 7-phosphate isomerase